MGSWILFLSLFSTLVSVHCQSSSSSDASVMQALKQSLNPPSSLGWTGSDPCKWNFVGCSNDNRIIGIQIGHHNLKGSLPSTLSTLTALKRLELMSNQLTGPLPNLSGCTSLQYLLLHNNNFSAIPADFFAGMTSLQQVYLDYNPFSPWSIPDTLRNATSLQVFSANAAGITGKIPDFFGGDTFSGLLTLHLAFNSLEGELPATFSGSTIRSLWLNGQQESNSGSSKLNGSISVIQNMIQLTDVWLQGNSFSGPLPDFSNLTGLQNFSARDNSFTGPVPLSLINLQSLKVVNLTNNLLQGPNPKFDSSVAVDLVHGTNSFCLSDAGVGCDPRVNTLLLIAQSVGYPMAFGQNWKGNDPCSSWLGITCVNGNITVINFQKMGLIGTISSNFSSITSLQRLILANNVLTGTIPIELTNLPNLRELDVSNNRLSGKIPSFRTNNVVVKVDGNPDIGKDIVNPSPGTPSGITPSVPSENGAKTKGSRGVLVGSLIGGVCGVFLLVLGVFSIYRVKKKKHSGIMQSPNAKLICRHQSGTDYDAVRTNVSGLGVNGESGNMVFSIDFLTDVTDNFNKENILGRGGFGTVYKGELDDGTKIAVKRMESGALSEQGLDEFQSEIAVLTKVRHRHLVSLLGYCLEANERLLVYEYIPQGTLSRHLFKWNEEGLKPLEWSKRLIIALDVARGVEYLHSLAHQSFVHRDLKPSNILLGDNMRAKVADFGLVRHAPDGKGSIITKLAGTFGYLAPEYAAMGRVTTKVDVFSFGVILMELITGRKALDETQQGKDVHLVTWFRKMHINQVTFRRAIDPTIELDEETLASISTVAELAGHCCRREPYQRPNMGHAVNVLSSLTDVWKPLEPDAEDTCENDFGITTLPQAILRWQAGTSLMDGSSSSSSSSFFPVATGDNTQTSIPTQPATFRSPDGR